MNVEKNKNQYSYTIVQSMCGGVILKDIKSKSKEFYADISPDVPV